MFDNDNRLIQRLVLLHLLFMDDIIGKKEKKEELTTGTQSSL
jgi:hypothetical protein